MPSSKKEKPLPGKLPGKQAGSRTGRPAQPLAGSQGRKVPSGRTLSSRAGGTSGAAQRPKVESPEDLKNRARQIARILIKQYPDARCMLDHRSAFELLVATILAAQCTDERVNMVTPGLFERYPGPEAMADASLEDLEEMVRSTGFFHNKAKSIKGASGAIMRELGGRFPGSMDLLLGLPGVGRKTANVVLAECFDTPSIIVDTHVRRVVQRLGLVDTDEPDGIEMELHDLVPRADWTRFSHAVTFHGRRCCIARKPECPSCPVRHLCPSAVV